MLDALSRRQNLTDTEMALAEYILTHADDMPEMTVKDLSQVAHCSGSSVVRLCRKLGLDGYRELRIEIARELERSRSNLLSVNPDRPFIEGSNTGDIASSIAALSKQAIDASYASLSLTTVRKAVNLLLRSRRVVYYAMGDSCASVEVFSQLLYKLGIICTNGMPKGDRGVLEHLLDSRDLAFIVTYSGRTAEAYKSTSPCCAHRDAGPSSDGEE